MIFFVSGIVELIDGDGVIVNNNGIGYKVKVPESLIPDIVGFQKQSKKIKLYTAFSIKDDTVNLCGFLSVYDLKLFNLLISVSGIGPKAAMSIISNTTKENIFLAVNREDMNLLGKVPGVGKKTAQRLILELKDKLDLLSDIAAHDGLDLDDNLLDSNGNKVNDAIEALLSLGYNRTDVVRNISQISDVNSLSTQEIIKLALKLFV